MAEGNNLLRDVRQKLARLEDSIMFALFERAQYCFNSKIYTPGAIKIPSFVVHAGKKDFFTLDYPFTLSVQYFHGSFLDYLLQGTEFLHSTAGRYAHPEEHPFFKDLPSPQIPREKYSQLIESVRKNKLNFNDELLQIYLEAIPRICKPGDDNEYGSAAIADIACLQALSRRIHLGACVAEAKFQEAPEEFGRLIRRKNKKRITRELRDEKTEQDILERVRQKGKRYGVDPQVIAEFYEKKIIPLTIKDEVAYLMGRVQNG